MATRFTGKVKFFLQDRGYGFIVPSGGGADVFVHKSAVQASNLPPLEQGQELSFEITTERNKDAAINLTPL